MVRLNEMTEPIQERELYTLEPMLRALQGNILRGHGRNRSVHIFLRFRAEEVDVKRWIRTFAVYVTSAWKQREQTEAWQQREQTEECQQQHDMTTQQTSPGVLLCNFFLSFAGYQYLNLDVSRFTKAFQYGMKSAGEKLQDPPCETWDDGYQKELHAMISLAWNQEEEALLRPEEKDLLQNIQQAVEAIAEICAVENGRAMKKDGKTIEHFGYADGLSQPLFFQEHVNQEAKKGGIDKWDPSAGPSLVVVEDPCGGENDYGSYLVFRKLEQNVWGFTDAIAELADILEQPAVRVGAQVVGRFQDGTPLVLHKSDQNSISNNFNFIDEDRYGLKCPFHAHIRKVNPRRELVATEDHRVVRRGITYGTRDKQLNDMPIKNVGLLFMCYQSNIETQFEFLQSQWANNNDHFWPGTGIDPVIGQIHSGQSKKQMWRPTWGHPGAKPFRLHNFVTLKGGEYFFAPSISVLKTL